MKKMIVISLSCILLTSVCAKEAMHTEVRSFKPQKFIPAHSRPTFINEPSLVLSSIANAAGYGGNLKKGRLTYPGTPPNLPALTVSRSPVNATCYLQNENVKILHYETNELIKFECISPDPEHDSLYWNADLGAVNGGFSPENDTLYGADEVTNMFIDWYHIPPVVDEKNNKKAVTFLLHAKSNGAWLKDNDDIVLGDAIDSNDYPYTSLPIISYMMAMIFTEQHSNLNWGSSQSGGINIAFSCMAAMAAEFFTSQINDWEVGDEISKNGEAMHYMDVPSKDCKGKKPGDGCSIDTLAQYKPGLSNYYSSGLFNRAFYLLATTSNWDAHKAFDVFMQANRYHWKSDTDFHQGACDAVKSAKELEYDAMSVMRAFSRVGIDTRDC